MRDRALHPSSLISHPSSIITLNPRFMPISFSRPRIIDIVAWCILAAAVIFAVYVRARLREFPLERDEGEFAYAGQLLLHGIPPYKLAYNMKLPGTYIAYAGLDGGVRADDRGRASWAAGGERGDDPVALPVDAGAVRSDLGGSGGGILCDHVGQPGRVGHGRARHALRRLLWRGGRLLALAVFAVAAVVVAAGERFSSRDRVPDEAAGSVPRGFRRRDDRGSHGRRIGETVTRFSGRGVRSRLAPSLQAAAFCVAAVLPYLLVCLWLWRAGVFKKFWFWTIIYAREYVVEVPLANAWQQFWYGEGRNAVASDGLVWLLAVAGLLVVAARGWSRPGRALFVGGYFIFSFLCVCPGFFFRSHYFIVALPAVALLAGAACGELLRLAALWKMSLAGRAGRKSTAGAAKKAASKAGVRTARHDIRTAGDSRGTDRAGGDRLALFGSAKKTVLL